MKKAVSILTGFMILFLLYHGAEYMIVFKNSVSGFFSFHAAFIMAAYLIAKWQFGKGLQTWGFYLNKKTFIQILAGFTLGIMLYTITFWISLLTGIEKIDFIPSIGKISGMLGLFMFGNFFSSFSEDVLTRAYVYKHLHEKNPVILLCIVSGVIYVLNHIYRLNQGFETLFYLFLLGILLIIPLLKTRQIWLTGSIHWASNCTFYLTHEIYKTSTPANGISPNYLFAAVIAIFGLILLIISKKYYELLSNNHSVMDKT